MIDLDDALPGVFAAMDREQARCVLVLAARSGEGVSTLSRALAEAAARRSRRATMLVDLDPDRDTHFRHFARADADIVDFRSGVLNGSCFFRVVMGRTLVQGGLDRFMVARIGKSRLFVTHFEREGLAEEARTRFAPGRTYWEAVRERTDYCFVDAPARDVSPIGVEAATAMDGVVLVVSGALGSAAASLSLKSELEERGARVLGIVYTEADRTVAWLERWFAKSLARKEAAP